MKWLIKASMCIVPAALLFAGCSSAPTAKSIAKDEAAAAELRAQAAADKAAMAQKQAERQLSNVPDWAMKPPKADAEGFYAVGMADSSNLDVAIKKSMLEAEFQLAKSYKAIVSGNERQFQKDQRDSGVTDRYTLLIDSVVDRVPLGGYNVVERELKPIDGKFYSFVLLKLPYEQANKLIASARPAQSDASIDEQFAQLERRLDKYRADRIEEESRIRSANAASVGGMVDSTRSASSSTAMGSADHAGAPGTALQH